MTQPAAEIRHVVDRSGFANPLTLGVLVEDIDYLKVYADLELLQVGVDYTVLGVGDANGVTIEIIGANDINEYVGYESFTALYDPVLQQGADLSLGGNFGRAFENALDIQNRQLQAVAERAYAVSANTNAAAESALIAAAAEAAAALAADAAEDAAAIAITGAGTPIFATLALARAYSPAVAPAFIETAGYAAAGDLGGALYKNVSSEPSHEGKLSITLSGGGAVWYELAETTLTPQMFGALGDGAQTLSGTSYATDSAGTPITITQQTTDGLAINRALVMLRSRGGGHLHLPKGEYRTWGYLERIDFPLLLTGDGPGVSIIKNCDTSPTNANGYGCLIVEPSTISDVTIENVTLDGNAVVRTLPTGEFRSYPLAVNGNVRARLCNVHSLNSPIDCLRTGYSNSADCSLQAVNCIFDNSFRNTVSLVGGWNQQFTNCMILRGGKVQGGTNPKYCLDIEPTAAANTIKDITLTNCIIRDAENVLAGGVWAGNVKFVGCSFVVAAQGASGLGYPWTGFWRGGEFSFTGCSFVNTTDYIGQFQCTNPVSTGDFVGTEFVSLKDCRFLGVGLEGYGANMLLDGVDFVSSKRPVSLKGNGTQSAIIRNVTLRNVYDATNMNGGANSAFAVMSTFEGALEIDGLRIISEPSTIPAAMTLTGITQQRGIHMAPTIGAAVSVKLSSIQVVGFYQKFPNYIAAALNTSNFRDWNSPNTAPADTAGQTTTPGALFYRNCTMYGNSA